MAARLARIALPSFLVFAVLFLLPAAVLAGKSKGPRGFKPRTATGDMPYVIITTAELAPSFQPLADWKTRTGLPACVVTVEALQADRSLGGNDVQEKMRSFLRGAYENWRTRWVCLGGHITVVPGRGVHLRRGNHGGNGSISDLYFGDVLPANASPDADVEIYNWNADCDARFGEPADGMDLRSEMYVARLPFEKPVQVKDYLKKYFDYVQSKDTVWTNRCLVVGAEEFRGRQERLTQILKDLSSDRDYTVDTLIEVPVKTIVESMNKGYAVLDIFGHGCPHHMWLGAKRAHFGVKQINLLKNKGRYGIVYSQGCSANDYRKWASMGVAFLNKAEGGAIAYTGYTATSFAHPVNELFYKYIYEGTYPQLSAALYEAKHKIRDIWTKEYLNTLGEPEMWVWTGSPRTLTVKGALKAGVPVKLTIEEGSGRAVPRARVLVKSGDLFLTGITDEQGAVSLSGLTKAGKARVTVMAQNAMLLETSMDVAKAEGPIFERPTVVIDDDRQGESKGNGKANLSPDETVELSLNWGGTLPLEGTVTLTVENDPFVKIERGSYAVKEGAKPFLLAIHEAVRPGHVVWACVTLQLPGQEGAWRWDIPLAVTGPSVRCVRCRLDDKKASKDGRFGWEDAGGSIAMFVTLFNRGNQDAAGCTMKLTTKDPNVTLTAGEVKLGDLEPGEAREPRKAFGFDLAAGYGGDPVVFQLTILDRDGGVWNATVKLCLPPAPPILLSHRAGTDFVQLKWRPGGSKGVYGFHVYRSTRSGKSYKRLTEKPVRGVTMFRDKTVKPNDDFFYVVTSVTAEGLESPYSMEHRVRTLSRLWGRKKR